MGAGDSETRNRLIKAAREEFISKGYMNASLRNICKEAGVTTGALYFIFKDKDELFEAIVGQPLNELNRTITEHIDLEMLDYGERNDEKQNEIRDLEVSGLIVEILFKYKEECILLLTQAAGSKFENIKDEFVAGLEDNYRIMVEKMVETNGYNRVDDYTRHYLTHMQVESFIYLLTHSQNKDEALAELPYIMKNIRGGWFEVFGGK